MSDTVFDWFRNQPPIQGPAARATPRPMAPLPTVAGRAPMPLPDVASPPPVAGRPRLPLPWTRATTPQALDDAKAGVSAKVVMHHFARNQVRGINAQADDLHGRLVACLRGEPEFAGASDEALLGVIEKITYRLQTAPLTINFAAADWFRNENDSRAYTQMYERGARPVTAPDGSQRTAIAGNANNDPRMRDAADTRVTFAPDFNTPAYEGARRFMATGGTEVKAGQRLIVNRKFNPKARQNFAALNYGWMRGGAANTYGKSHLVLKNNLKNNAVFYMGDTFDVAITAAMRATHGTLFSLFLYANAQARKMILDACYRHQVLPGSCDKNTMIEAHLFTDILFARDVECMVVDRQDLLMECVTQGLDQVYVESHMKMFCRRNGIRLMNA